MAPARSGGACPLPTFLYIGASRAGSSWLFEVLREHPDVYVPDAKDLMYFHREFGRGLSWYLSFFADAQGYTARGELSHDYFLSAVTAARIRAVLPDVRLLCCLREPVEKTVSMYHYNRTTTFHYRAPDVPAHKLSFERFVQLPDVIHLVKYYQNLEPYYQLFPADRICVMFYDDLKTSPPAFARDVFCFLGVDASIVPPSVHRKVNAAREARILLATRAAYRIGVLVRVLGFAGVVGAVKRSPIFERALYRPAQHRPAVPAHCARQLHERCSADYKKLEALIGRPLPPAWYEVP